MCDVPSLVGKPKLFFIEACRGREHNMGRELVMTKSSAPVPRVTQGISLPNKQDVFVGFATVPGFVSFTSSLGSPYLQVCKNYNFQWEKRENPLYRRLPVCCRPTTRTQTCPTSTFWSNAGLPLSTLVRSCNLSMFSRQRRRPARSGGALESFEQTSVFKAGQRQRLHHWDWRKGSDLGLVNPPKDLVNPPKDNWSLSPPSHPSLLSDQHWNREGATVKKDNSRYHDHKRAKRGTDHLPGRRPSQVGDFSTTNCQQLATSIIKININISGPASSPSPTHQPSPLPSQPPH